MTDAEIRKLYTQYYCSKEAASWSSIAKAIPGLYKGINTKLINLWKNLGKKRGVGSSKPNTPNTPNTPPPPPNPSSTPNTSSTPSAPSQSSAPNTPPTKTQKVVDFVKKHPYLTTTGAVTAGSVGVGGYKALSGKSELTGWENLMQYINDNPGKIALLAGGLLTAPLWMPPLISAFTGNNSPYSGYQMGRYYR